MTPHTKKHSLQRQASGSLWITGSVLGLIFVAILIGFFIIRSKKETISSAAEEMKLRMSQNMSPLAVEQTAGGVISSQLFGRDRQDLYTSNVRDATVASGEFLDIYLSQNIRPTLRRRTEVSESGMKHVFYEQYINGKRVYGSHAAVHVKDGNMVRGATAAVVAATQVEQAVQTEQQATQKALSEAAREAPGVTGWRILSTENVIFNGRLKGYSDDDRNIPALLVRLTVSPEQEEGLNYVISLLDGSVLDVYPANVEAVNRTIYNCPTFDPARPSTVICTQSRTEGVVPIGVADTDEAYDAFGTIYNTFSTSLAQKSHDNRDGLLLGRTNLPKEITNAGGSKPCAKGNAWWNTVSKSMFYCAGWVSLDISAHEIGHGVVFNYVPDFGRNFQTGAINEGIADMFGMLVDADDWNMGEDSPIGIVRHLDDPTKGGRPDRMFSANYGCVASGGSASSSNDYGYIHKNATVLGKWFYLTAQGGAFNGCTVPGIGREAAMKIVHKAVSGGYISASANFKNVYDAMNAACADLNGSASAPCQSVLAAGKATELDQQAAGTQQGPRCTGATPKPPSCGAIATATPGSQACTNKNKGDADCNDSVDIIDYALWRVEYKSNCSPATLTNASCSDDRDGDGNLMDADFNADANVSLIDFQIWRQNFK